MKTHFRSGPIIILCLLLTACGILPGLPAPAAADSGPTPTPLPTSTAPEFPTVDDQSCLLAELEPLRTDAQQGDLIAWQPDEDVLAYVGPALNSNWYAGKIMLASGPEFTAPLNLAPEAHVFGDLAWSPDGSLLAYISLRISDDVYTILTSSPQGGSAQDWLSGEIAFTEDGASSKAISEWQGNQRLSVLSACGPDCDQITEINLNNGQISAIGEQIRRAKDRLAITYNQLDYDAEIYPFMPVANWSPDGEKIVYFDEDDRAWVLLVEGNQQYIIDIGINTPREAKWASDNRLLALRTDDVIYIFDTECK